MTISCITMLSTLFLLAGTGAVLAGSLDPPAAPSEPASAMYTVNDLYNRLATGALGAKRTGPFVEPTAPLGPTGHTIDEIIAAMPLADNTNGAAVADVLAGRTFWGLRTDGTWGLKTGAMPPQVLNAASTAVPAGYYVTTTLTAVDPDLATANIRAGVSIFGVNGKPELVDTAETVSPAAAGQILAGRKAFVNGAALTGTIMAGTNVNGPNGSLTIPIPDAMYQGGRTATAVDTNLVSDNIRNGVTVFGVTGTALYPVQVQNTGQFTCYDGTGVVIDCAGTGQDGALQKGVAPPSPRFTDNGTGTVTDNLTGLIWLKKADCFIAKSWWDALTAANNLATGSCGLSDGSIAGHWRLPNIKELLSLNNLAMVNPALPSGHPFTGVKLGDYWSSTSSAGTPSSAWTMSLINGAASANTAKNSMMWTWTVKGGP